MNECFSMNRCQAAACELSRTHVDSIAVNLGAVAPVFFAAAFDEVRLQRRAPGSIIVF